MGDDEVESSESEEIEKPPERRAPSGRAGRGGRMQRLIQEEEDEAEEQADKDFYTQGFWADEDADDDFNGDADDEEARDSFDSDFGDSTESSSDEESGDDKPKKKAAKKKSVYRDPKLAHKKGEAPEGGSMPPPKPKSVHKRKPRPEGGLELPAAVRSRDSLRTSTQDSSIFAEEKRKAQEAAVKARQEQAERLGKKRGAPVELRRLTQEEILAEAQQTEIINRASLERMLRVAEEKRRVVARERNLTGPRIRYASRRTGDPPNYKSVTTVSFLEMPVPKAVDGIAPPYPVPNRCAVTGQPAKYIDPATGTPYATLEAFRVLRGRTGRRHHSGPAVAPNSAGGSGSGTPLAPAEE